MEIIVGLLTLGLLGLPLRPATTRPKPAVALDCPADMSADEVCVFTDNAQIVAINPTTGPVRVVVQIQRIENVELIYRYPFVEELPPRSSRTLIKYRVVKDEHPYALDYDWGWTKR